MSYDDSERKYFKILTTTLLSAEVATRIVDNAAIVVGGPSLSTESLCLGIMGLWAAVWTGTGAHLLPLCSPSWIMKDSLCSPFFNLIETRFEALSSLTATWLSINIITGIADNSTVVVGGPGLSARILCRGIVGLWAEVGAALGAHLLLLPCWIMMDSLCSP